MNNMTLYVAGHLIAETEQGLVWDILGIFDSEDMAVQTCYDENCFVGPLRLNEALPTEIISWVGAYYTYWKK